MLACWTQHLTGLESFQVEIEDDSLVVYTPDSDPAEEIGRLRELLGGFPGSMEAEREFLNRHLRYTAMLRFTLVDEQRRLFSAERWCFRSSVDGWFPLAGGRPLEGQARKYLPHVTKESFFELM